jgi:undecaprenyl-diphosphatase
MTRSARFALACLIGFAALAALWTQVPAWRRFDAASLDWIRRRTPDALASSADTVTTLGSLPVTISIALVLAVTLWHRNRGRTALTWSVMFFGGQAVLYGLKLAFGRPRPQAPDLLVRHFGFPSGHAFTSMVLYGALLYAGWHWMTAPWMRWTLAAAMSMLILTIGWSRLILQVHYPTDVLGGYILGIAWLAFTWMMLHRQGTVPPRKPSISSSTRLHR